ncbi:hypothetical protein BCR34DRAFT_600719 [Clohesyomyces aquaticus]|uniref:Uncharacterized protein n=1 Tax=Clohesyomyces aquaticus TaxID=1231657 RepID=A0A1Y1ZQ31_9PLEO|nr:hypothetical protein BCR34DRAFT_600719 [Clohesyomyces aquaticus]
MFGHPGISAWEFAGTHTQKREAAQQETEKLEIRKTMEVKRTSSTHYDNSAETETVANVGTADNPAQLATTVSHQELSCQQRRRGTFVNHTPRKFEIAAVKKWERQRVSGELYSRDGTIYGQGSEEGGSFEVAPFLHHWNFGFEEPKDKEQDPVRKKTNEILSRSQFEYDGESTAGVMLGRIPRPAPLKISTSRNGQENERESSIEGKLQTLKCQRRQTPYRMIPPTSSSRSRHSPLEPFVAWHRREGTGSSVELPSTPNNTEEYVAAFSYRSYKGPLNSHKPIFFNPHGCLPASDPPCIPALSFSQATLSSSPTEPTAMLPIEDPNVPVQPPDVPSRNPMRLATPPPRLPIRGTPRISNASSEFSSAARGTYSPYDKGSCTSSNTGRPRAVRLGQTETTDPGIIRRMAPPIMGHHALTASAELNEFCDYLRNTGPKEPPPRSTKKKAGFNIFKVGNKKNLASQAGSVEGSPNTNRPRTPMPACAKEMTTSSGAKHLRIMISTGHFEHDRTITLPVSGTEDGAGGSRRSKHVSITWTEEMMNPLGSPKLEQLFSDCNENPGVRPPTPVRSPRRSPAVSKPVPVEDHHPLATREERIRARKLRDMQRVKRKENNHMRRADDGDFALVEVKRLEDVIVGLRRRNRELVKALGEIVGVDTNGDEEDVDAILNKYEEAKGFGVKCRDFAVEAAQVVV